MVHPAVVHLTGVLFIAIAQPHAIPLGPAGLGRGRRCRRSRGGRRRSCWGRRRRQSARGPRAATAPLTVRSIDNRRQARARRGALIQYQRPKTAPFCRCPRPIAPALARLWRRSRAANFASRVFVPQRAALGVNAVAVMQPAKSRVHAAARGLGRIGRSRLANATIGLEQVAAFEIIGAFFRSREHRRRLAHANRPWRRNASAFDPVEFVGHVVVNPQATAGATGIDRLDNRPGDTRRQFLGASATAPNRRGARARACAAVGVDNRQRAVHFDQSPAPRAVGARQPSPTTGALGAIDGLGGRGRRCARIVTGGCRRRRAAGWLAGRCRGGVAVGRARSAGRLGGRACSAGRLGGRGDSARWAIARLRRRAGRGRVPGGRRA